MRLLTRANFEGLVCSALLMEKGLVDTIEFVHSKDIQDGIIKVSKNDILAAVPFVEDCCLWFDNHATEEERLELELIEFEGDYRPSDSTAQLIWDYFGGNKSFSDNFLPILEGLNRCSSAALSINDVIHPKGWVLLSFLIDSRTGLERYCAKYDNDLEQTIIELAPFCGKKSVEEILSLPFIAQRASVYAEHQKKFIDMLKQCCQPEGNVIVGNFLDQETIYCGNRFMVYILFPEQNIEVRSFWGKNKENVVISCGHSIINRTSLTDVGKLMLKFGGGGHERVGTCQVSIDKFKPVVNAIVEHMRQDG